MSNPKIVQPSAYDVPPEEIVVFGSPGSSGPGALTIDLVQYLRKYGLKPVISTGDKGDYHLRYVTANTDSSANEGDFNKDWWKMYKTVGSLPFLVYNDGTKGSMIVGFNKNDEKSIKTYYDLLGPDGAQRLIVPKEDASTKHSEWAKHEDIIAMMRMLWAETRFNHPLRELEAIALVAKNRMMKTGLSASAICMPGTRDEKGGAPTWNHGEGYRRAYDVKEPVMTSHRQYNNIMNMLRSVLSSKTVGKGPTLDIGKRDGFIHPDSRIFRSCGAGITAGSKIGSKKICFDYGSGLKAYPIWTVEKGEGGLSSLPVQRVENALIVGPIRDWRRSSKYQPGPPRERMQLYQRRILMLADARLTGHNGNGGSGTAHGHLLKNLPSVKVKYGRGKKAKVKEAKRILQKASFTAEGWPPAQTVLDGAIAELNNLGRQSPANYPGIIILSFGMRELFDNNLSALNDAITQFSQFIANRSAAGVKPEVIVMPLFVPYRSAANKSGGFFKNIDDETKYDLMVVAVRKFNADLASAASGDPGVQVLGVMSALNYYDSLDNKGKRRVPEPANVPAKSHAQANGWLPKRRAARILGQWLVQAISNITVKQGGN